MSKCQAHTIPRPYLEVTALPLLAEVLGVCNLLAGVLEPREAVQLQADLTCGPQSANRILTINVYGQDNKSDHLAGGRLVSPSCRTVLTAPCSSELPALISITKFDNLNFTRSLWRETCTSPSCLGTHIHIISCVLCLFDIYI